MVPRTIFRTLFSNYEWAQLAGVLHYTWLERYARNKCSGLLDPFEGVVKLFLLLILYFAPLCNEQTSVEMSALM